MSSPSRPQQSAARFVILEHDWPFVHWDFLLESDSVLRAWRLLEPVQRDRWIAAQPLPDHRLIYLDYEGPVSGDRGDVHRIASGTFTAEAGSDAAALRLRLSESDVATQAMLQVHPDGRSEWRFS